MHLFTRTRTINTANTPEALAFSVEHAQYVSKVTGLEVIPWASVYGDPVGTISSSVRVESQAAMGAALATLAADAGYQKRVADAAGRLFVGSTEDVIGEFVSFAGSGGSDGSFATVITAQCAPGRIAEAMTWGVDILNHASKVTGLDGSFVRGLYGPWASVAWVNLAETLEEVDAAAAALAADATYLERVDDGGVLFLPGSANQRLIRRLG
jgi:hypothetical protein